MNHAPTLTRAVAAARRTVPALLVALMLSAGLLAAQPTAAQAFQAVKRGDHGKRVATVQRVLGLTVDRRFGPATVRAVKRFQRRRGLAADGIVGRVTWRALMRVARRQRAARNGGRGSLGSRAHGREHYVRVLQRELGVPADGVFGPGTARALKRFQAPARAGRRRHRGSGDLASSRAAGDPRRPAPATAAP